VDGEHCPIGDEALKRILIASKGYDTSIIYRVRENNPGLIKIALDLGVDGLMIPMVNTQQEAQAAVSASRYPPQGKRGIGPWRASNYYEDYVDYVAQANKKISIILQIEDVDALSQLDQILEVPGFDAVFIGPADLTASLGLFPNTEHSQVEQTINEIVQACKKASMPIGIDASDLTYIQRMSAKGLQFFTYGMDISYLIEGARNASTSAKELLSTADTK
ncbi:MAG: aldolase/citrate lyase family protein, partial [Oceanospirillaceae bacterium]